MGGQTCGETMGYGMVARIGAGVNAEMMHAERVDGYNPLAVIDAFKRKKKILLDKKGPVLLDTLTYRFSGHSPSDASSYRSKEEVEAWQKVDSIITYGQNLNEAGITAASSLDSIKQNIIEEITGILKLAIDDNLSPRLNLSMNPDAIADLMFSNGSVDSLDDRKPESSYSPRRKSKGKKSQNKTKVLPR